MHVKCTKSAANVKLVHNLIDSSDISTLPTASSADWLDYRLRELLDWSSDWLRAVGDGMISVECPHTNFRNPNLGPPIRFFRHWAFLLLGTPETPFRNTDLNEYTTLRQCRNKKYLPAKGNDFPFNEHTCVFATRTSSLSVPPTSSSSCLPFTKYTDPSPTFCAHFGYDFRLPCT
jgi:hypothetical protein